MVMRDSSNVHLIELTVPHESCLEYSDLAVTCRHNGFLTTLTTIQVGSRGFLHHPNVDNLYTSWSKLLSATRQTLRDNWLGERFRGPMPSGAAGTLHPRRMASLKGLLLNSLILFYSILFYSIILHDCM